MPDAPSVERIVEGSRDKGRGEDGEDHVEDGHNKGARALDAGGPWNHPMETLRDFGP